MSEICSYGCGGQGLFKKHGRNNVIKWSCSDNIQHCPAMKLQHSLKTKERIERQKASGQFDESRKKLIESRSSVGADGLTSYQRGAKKMATTRKKLNSYDSGAHKAAKTKKTKIDPQTGLTIETLGVIRANQTRMAVDDTGTSIAQRVGRKGMLTRLTTIDPKTGLNSYELAEVKSRRFKPYKSTALYYASSYEFKWIEQLESNYGLDWVLSNVTRGPNFRYFDDHDKCMRNYPSDFRIGNTIYEIKSCYIFHKTLLDRERNIKKLDTVLSEGYVVKLVLNFKEYDWSTDKDVVLSIV